MNNQEEYRIQCKVASYLDSLGVLWTASSNGIKLPLPVAVRLKKQGYRKGSPDIYIFEPRGPYHGMMIELKSHIGTANEFQKKWNAGLNKRNYFAIICEKQNSEMEQFLWIKKQINNYLELK